MPRLRVPALETLFVGAFALLGFGAGARPIGDNSMFVHLRTGIDMARGMGIPRVDPYSFTAAGERWVVQSWLAELTYGVLHRIGGMGLVMLQQGVLTGALAWLIASLARAGTPVRTLAAAAPAIAIGLRYWAPRPLLFGLLGLGLLVMAVERRWNPWWLLPIAWMWVNTHGSFALGLLWLALRLVGERVDSGVVSPWNTGADHSRAAAARYGAVFVLGVALGAVNPLGPRLLLFAATVVEKRGALQEVVEWRSPSFAGPLALVSLAGLAAALGILMYRRAGAADLLPVLGFVAAGLMAQRNLAAAGIVVAPALARALRPAEEADAGAPRSPLHLAFVAVLLVAAAGLGASALRDPALDMARYPVAAVRWLEAEGLRDAGTRIAHQDFVGASLILRDGREASVFVDDRVDMYPELVIEDYLALLRGRPRSLELLDARRIDAVLWERDAALATILDATPEWDRAYVDEEWVVFVREARTGG